MKIVLYNINNSFADQLGKIFNNEHIILPCDDAFSADEYIINNEADAILYELNENNTLAAKEFLKILKASGIDVPVILVASISNISLAVECLKLGAFDYIEKLNKNDYPVENILSSIKKIVEKKQSIKRDISIFDFEILFVDDNVEFTKSIKYYFGKKYTIDVCNDFIKARDIIAQKKYDIIFLDIKDEIQNDDSAGIKLLKDTINKDEKISIIMLSGWADTVSAVESLKFGAKDFIEKSLKIDDTFKCIDTIINNLYEEKKKYKNDSYIKPVYRIIDIIGECALIKNIKKEIIELAQHNVPVIIYGETGTGKEMVASSIHMACPRRDNQFIELNCGSIPETLFESELFGYKKGAFTNASNYHIGKMELADKGTLFLDEIENLTLNLQAKLLRVLEDKKIYPLGSNEGKVVDFRLICATNVDLSKLIQEGMFREDLFYRLNVYNIELPSLKERGEQDILLLIKHFLRNKNIVSIETDALDMLRKYSWPGNVRELRNLLNKFEVIANQDSNNIITYDIVKEGFRKYRNKEKLTDLLNEVLEYYNGNIPSMLVEFEDKAVLNAYKEYNGNISQIAQRVYKEAPGDNKNHRERVRKVLERNKHLM